jgi:hypothetical protein
VVPAARMQRSARSLEYRRIVPYSSLSFATLSGQAIDAVLMHETHEAFLLMMELTTLRFETIEWLQGAAHEPFLPPGSSAPTLLPWAAAWRGLHT